MAKKRNNPNDKFNRRKSPSLNKTQQEIDTENKLKKLKKKLNPTKKKQINFNRYPKLNLYGGLYGRGIGNHGTIFNNPPISSYWHAKGFIGPHPENCNCVNINCIMNIKVNMFGKSAQHTVYLHYAHMFTPGLKNIFRSSNWFGVAGTTDEEEEEMYTIITWDSLMDAYSLIMKDIEKYNWKNVKPVLDAFKTMVPASARNFDFDTKVWHFQEQYLDGVKVLFETIPGNKVQVTVKPEYSPKVNLSIQTPDIVIFAKVCNLDLEEAKKLDLNSAKKVYRQAAMIYHPDKNSSNEAALKMSELNEVWNRLKAGYFLNEVTARV